MYLRDSQVTIMPKYTSSNMGGETFKYSSDHIVMKGGKKSKKNRASRKKIRRNRGTRKNRNNGKK
jgi:hypothetical protein